VCVCVCVCACVRVCVCVSAAHALVSTARCGTLGGCHAPRNPGPLEGSAFRLEGSACRLEGSVCRLEGSVCRLEGSVDTTTREAGDPGGQAAPVDTPAQAPCRHPRTGALSAPPHRRPVGTSKFANSAIWILTKRLFQERLR
jgi:hypothetical protein